MQIEKPIPTEIKKSLQNFVVAYFFVLRIQLENAEIIHRTLNSEIPKNFLLIELGHGYIKSAVTEFALLLYDTVDLLKNSAPSYNFKSDGAIGRVFKFRRHILAHRGRNWGSQESRETISFFSQDTRFETFHEAAAEFTIDLCKYMSFEPIDSFPVIQEIRKPDLDHLVKNSPELSFAQPTFTEADITKFFGINMRPNS